MDVTPLLAAARAVTRRIRLARALRAGVATLAPGVAGIAVALAARHLGRIGASDLHLAVLAGVGIPLLVALASGARRLPSLLGAELVDRAHALHGRVVAALELVSREDPSPLAALAIDDALARAKDLSPARAFPLRVPAHARTLALACAALGVAATIERPRLPPPEPAPPPRLAPLLVHPDDLALEQDALHALEARPDPTPELRAAIDDTNALLEALEDRAIERTEALRRLGELTARLERPRPTSLAQREQLLEEIGDRLGRGEVTSDLSTALREHDADAAREALEALADRLRERTLSAEERRRLREALAEARASEGDDETERELADAEEELAQREQEAFADGEEEERLLEQQREEVERLREQHRQRMEAQQELERLERELGEAADEMDEADAGDEEAARSLDEAAEDLNRTARDQEAEEQMRQLAQQLRQLREMIRRQREQQGGRGEDGEGGDGSGQGSESGQSGRMDRYVLRAGGGDDGSGGGMRVGMRSGGGSSGDGETEGSQGEGGEDDEDGTPGGASGSAQGEDGEGGQGGDGSEEQPMLVLGDEGGGSAILELPGFGRGGTGDASGGGEGEGDEAGGAGHDHDPTSLTDPTDRAGDHRTVAVHGDDRGRGPSRSEVIRGGAAQGFASRDYERVYADYEAHAERAIEQDEIPPGYRFYVRRYFDLIRPRD